MTEPTPTQLAAELRLTRRHAHTADAERADAEARLLETEARVLRADAQAARANARTVTLEHALNQVRRLCRLTVRDSMRVQAREQAEDTLLVIQEAMAGEPAVGDGAWHSVWLHGNWSYLTKQMTTPEREHAADAVARYDAHLAAEDGEPGRGEPSGLRWWRADS